MLMAMAISQASDEGFRSFAARLRSQAKVLKIPKNCSRNPLEAVSYTDELVCYALNRGLGDLVTVTSSRMYLDKTTKI